MKLRTSYCKLTTFKKDLTRFAPVWALYLIGILLIFAEMGGYSTYDRFAWSSMDEIVMSFGIVNICYAGICALVLFGDLYNTRMCYSLHTQPARREHLFLSHLAAALCFSLVPNLVGMCIMMAELGAYWTLALYWLLASTVQFVFYFGLASLSAMCASNRVGMIAVYAVLNFFSMIAYWVVDTIYLPQMNGVVLNLSDFVLVCPTVQLFEFDFFQFRSVQTWLEETREWGTFYEYTGLGTGWGYLAILAGIGVAALGLSVVLYRLRHLESAGDLIAFPKLSPAVGVVLTVCVAVGLAFFGDALGSGYLLWLAVGMVVGWFGSRMLIERRVKVFRLKNILGFAALVAVTVASFLVIALDLFGIVSYVPRQDQVASVTIYNYKKTGSYEDYYYGNRIQVKLEDPEQIGDIITAHQDILDRMTEDHNPGHRVTISYKLKSGRTVVRSYAAPAYGDNYEIFRRYFYTPEQILGYTDWYQFVKNMEYLSVDSFDVPPQYRAEFLLALKADVEKGAVNFSDKSENIACWVYLRSRPGGNYISRDLAVSSEAENTLALLKSAKIVLGYEDAAKVTGIQYLVANGTEVDEQYRKGLLEALLKDFANGNISYDGRGEYYIEYAIGAGDNVCYRYFSVDKYAENTVEWIKNYPSAQ